MDKFVQLVLAAVVRYIQANPAVVEKFVEALVAYLISLAEKAIKDAQQPQ